MLRSSTLFFSFFPSDERPHLWKLGGSAQDERLSWTHFRDLILMLFGSSTELMMHGRWDMDSELSDGYATHCNGVLNERTCTRNT
jgi:hypothetical protein